MPVLPKEETETKRQICEYHKDGFAIPFDERIGWKQIHSEIKRAIGELPETLQETLLLYCIENMSYAQIAMATNVNIGTVKSRIHHARRYLVSMLNPDDLDILRNRH